jgi:methionyl-tRNA formyltransferase
MARLAFFGTPDFAVPSLEALLDAQGRGHELVLVVSQPDRRRGRGKAMQPPPVKARALEAGIEMAQPSTLKLGSEDGDAFRARFTELEVDLAVVAAYGRILPRGVLRTPKRGFVNVHGSLLPRWRGAAPVQRAIEAGDEETGACLMDMVFELDAGDVYAESRIPIAADDDGGTLSEKVAELGRQLLHEHLEAILEGTLPKTPQPEEGVTYAHMLKKEEGEVRWERSAQQVVWHARAMHPWPGAYTKLGEETLKLFAPRLAEDAAGDAAPGTVLASETELVVAAGQGAVAFADAQLPGKKRMAVRDLVRGRPMEAGTRLGAQAT